MGVNSFEHHYFESDSLWATLISYLQKPLSNTWQTLFIQFTTYTPVRCYWCPEASQILVFPTHLEKLCSFNYGLKGVDFTVCLDHIDLMDESWIVKRILNHWKEKKKNLYQSKSTHQMAFFFSHKIVPHQPVPTQPRPQQNDSLPLFTNMHLMPSWFYGVFRKLRTPWPSHLLGD